MLLSLPEQKKSSPVTENMIDSEKYVTSVVRETSLTIQSEGNKNHSFLPKSSNDFLSMTSALCIQRDQE